MSKVKADVCGYKGCGELAVFIIELDSRRMAICKEHYYLLIRRLQERAKKNGLAELHSSDLDER